jgi:hypothetical protein
MSNYVVIHKPDLYNQSCRQQIEYNNNHRKLDRLDTIHNYGTINPGENYDYVPCSDCYEEVIVENYNG